MTAEQVVLGTGAVGRAIAEELVRRGERVRMVNRTGRMAEPPPGVELSSADLYDPGAVREATRGARVVYHAANPPYHEWVRRHPALQKSILDGLSGRDLKLVLVENLYHYGPNGRAELTEETPVCPGTRKGRVRAEISRAAFDAHRAGRLRVTAGRGSDYFGPWGRFSTVMGERTFDPLLQGRPAGLVGNVDVPHTHTFLPDFGKALVILGERDEADGLAWHVPNDSPRITQRQLVTLIAETAGVEPKFRAMGRTMMALGGWFIPAARETVEMMYEFEQPFIVNSKKFEHAFGMKPTPVREAIRTTVDWYRAHPSPAAPRSGGRTAADGAAR